MIEVTLQEVVIAGWLHDIGKFAQRAGIEKYHMRSMEGQLCRLAQKGGYYTHQHVLYTLGFLESVKDCFPNKMNPTVIINLASYHHNPSSDEHWVITLADRLSSGSDRRTDKELEYESAGKFFEKPMLNLASTLVMDGQKAEKTAYVKMMPMEGEALMATSQSKIGKEDYKKLWDAFEKDFRSLKGLSYMEFELGLDTMLERYTWCIPSSTMDDPDISLYHHSKTTAAFATGVYRYAKNSGDSWRVSFDDSGPFMFVSGDISGIQHYIFDLPNPTNNAKMLRARSFQVWALSKIIAQHIVRVFGVGEANIITFAGGRFLLLIPSQEGATSTIERIKEELDKYFINQFGGRLACVLSTHDNVPIAALQQKSGSKLMMELQRLSSHEKKKKMQRGLGRLGPVLHGLYDELQKYGACSCCGWQPQSSERGLCRSCEDLVAIGSALVKASCLTIESSSLGEFGDMVHVSRGVGHLQGYLNGSYKAGYPTITLPYIAPLDEHGENLLTFEDIAKLSRGNSKLAMFKADVDNLGLIFNSSLGERWSLSRYASLSYQFQSFFSAYFTHYISQDPVYKKSIYTVFSGGDDLCVLGPWDVIMRFASDFKKELDKFTGNNPVVTLSGGIALASSSIPVKEIAAMAEDELDKSKQREIKGKLIKNGITVFDTTLDWEEYDGCLKDGAMMLDYLKDEKSGVSTATVYKLIDFSNRAKNVKRGKLKDLLWMSNYRYSIVRNLNNPQIREWFARYGVSPEKMQKAKVAASYALYAIRKNNK